MEAQKAITNSKIQIKSTLAEFQCEEWKLTKYACPICGSRVSQNVEIWHDFVKAKLNVISIYTEDFICEEGHHLSELRNDFGLFNQKEYAMNSDIEKAEEDTIEKESNDEDSATIPPFTDE